MNRDFIDYRCEEGRKLTADSLSRVQICVQDMVEEGFLPCEIASALGVSMIEQLKVAFPDERLRAIWIAGLLA